MPLGRFALDGAPRFQAVTGARTGSARTEFQLVATRSNSVGGTLPIRQSVFTAAPVAIPRTVNPVGSVPRAMLDPLFLRARFGPKVSLANVGVRLSGGRNPQGRSTNAPTRPRGPEQRGRPAAAGRVGRGREVSAAAKEKKPGRAVSAAARAVKPGAKGILATGAPTAKTVAVASVAAVVALPFLPGVLVL